MSNIPTKIDALFALRRIPELLELAGIDRNSGWVLNLFQLQTDIYQLDKHLENHWEPDPNQLAHYWEQIIKSLRYFQVDLESPHWLFALQSYQKQELEMRDAIWPHELPIRPFYYQKSCDVKLIRKLIYRRSPQLSQRIPIQQWIIFDLLTELIDDVEDVHEDLQVINGNRWMTSLLLRGAECTRIEYFQFIRYLHEQFTANSQSWYGPLLKWTEQVWDELWALINQDKSLNINEWALVSYMPELTESS